MHRIASLTGTVLKALFSGLVRVRHPRPVHPHGVALTGEMRWLGPSGSGIAWVDEPPSGPQRVSARASRSIGVPAPLPDVIGLALRVDDERGPVHLALASTGRGPVSRWLLMTHRSPSSAWLSTFLPYTGSRGSLLLAARPLAPSDLPSEPSALAAALRETPWRLLLHVATPTGRWHPFAELTLWHETGALDTSERIDVGAHIPPGATVGSWIHAIRDPSYREVQARTSGEPSGRPQPDG
ncbi:hypothetical protein GCM10017576_30840 [Microbacterium barkeri]|uniref:Phosphodiesterase n=1 Tax=Microbacterium barkeri TaxID=33917 RepID=A0A9W6LY66_9MICO|nr:hypothetical protein [Microbacterium barkeri]MDR6877822.1 hypothetical protein [Microbacterium barkeri]GLJ62953.1 hypothetical protein GCM10017576_30840 [Microbacterium barkeri]